MRKKILIAIISIASFAVFFVGWHVYNSVKYDDPDNFANVPVSMKDMNGWKSYQNEYFGFEIKYPENYFLAQKSDFNSTTNIGHVSFRQGTSSQEGHRTLGKRIGLHIFRLGPVTGISLGGNFIKVNKDTTVSDIAQQFLEGNKKTLVQRTCHYRDINGNNTIICIIRAPGEIPSLTGGIFEVFVLGVYEMENGERILVQMSNSAGGTPYTGDRTLRLDVLRIFHTYRWKSLKKQ